MGSRLKSAKSGYDGGCGQETGDGGEKRRIGEERRGTVVSGKESLDRAVFSSNLFVMTATAFLELKQRASRLPEKERQSLSAFLIRLGQERAGWKHETARRLNAMAAGKKVSVAELRKQLGHA